MILNPEVSNDIANLAKYYKLTNEVLIAYLFLLIIIFSLYLNFASKRILKYIN